ncbi:MAG TPA: hypothetical protein VFJ85_01745 [Acidimicrobiales bacterium]|nr:hypothetical protein [Acidimicrobiales bacterium]
MAARHRRRDVNILDAAGLPAAPDGGPPVVVGGALLDQVPWAAEVAPVALLGYRVAVRSQDAGLGRFVEAFVAAFPPADGADIRLDVVAVGGRWVGYENGVRGVTAPTVAAMARTLVFHLNALALAGPTDDVLVHAAVAAKGGRAVLLPGESGAGKTTLVAALALDGWEYLSDEVAPLGPGGAVVAPFPRPLAMEPGSWPLLPATAGRWPADVPALVDDLRLVLPATLRSGGPVTPAVPAAVVFPEVVPGAPTTLEPLPRAEALARLVGSTFNLRALGKPGFDRLAGCVARSACFRLVLDGVAEAPSALSAVLDEPPMSDSSG